MRYEDIDKTITRYLNKAITELKLSLTDDAYYRIKDRMTEYVLYPRNTRTGERYGTREMERRLASFEKPLPKGKGAIINKILGRGTAKEITKLQSELLGINIDLNKINDFFFAEFYNDWSKGEFGASGDSDQWQDEDFLTAYEYQLWLKNQRDAGIITGKQYRRGVNFAFSDKFKDDPLYDQYRRIRLENQHYTAEEYRNLQTNNPLTYKKKK